MLFPDEALFDYVLTDFAEEMAARDVPAANPLPCDRYVARSCLQKACRRNEPALAQRALANLFQHDVRATWRHLAIIALEDVGVANVDIVARIVGAYRNRKWRQQNGGNWAVMAELVRQMATSDHCQAACDLLLRTLNDPANMVRRAEALEEGISKLASVLMDSSALLEERSIAALAMGGGLTEGQQHNDPCAVFDVLAEASRSPHVVATCRAAWKLTRNPMAFLLPLIWEKWIGSDHHIADDAMPPVTLLNGVPGYTLDQFTRIGNTISRAIVRSDDQLRQMLIEANVPPAAHSRTVGDLIFLIEGGLLANRAIWPEGDRLRLPHRGLPAVGALAENLEAPLAHIAAKGSQIALIRRQQFSLLNW